jgi:hypothetical protein
VDDRGIGVLFPAKARNSSLLHSVHTGSGAHPATYIMGTERSSTGGIRPGREADHSPPSSDVKNGTAIIHSSTRLHEVVLN